MEVRVGLPEMAFGEGMAGSVLEICFKRFGFFHFFEPDGANHFPFSVSPGRADHSAVVL